MRSTTLLLVALAVTSTTLGLMQACATDPAPGEAGGANSPTAAHEAAMSAAASGGMSAEPSGSGTSGLTADQTARRAHAQEVMKSSYCAACHPAAYAEHEQNTHGRAFTDEEVRLGTGRFSQSDCIICHTPRPIFETGIGMNPVRRHYDLEEGNTCMTCHWRQGYDYGRFEGGAQCKDAFDPRVGEVEACASCHRNHGTPFQWELAKNGRKAGRVCIDCHMPLVERPIAVGMQPTHVHSHEFPASRSEAQLRRAYSYDARIDGDEVVVTVTNKGAGHNFPTELKQRSVESFIVVRDDAGREVARSRMTFRDPYKRPYGLTLPVNTQIPSGETREHRVPLGVASGTVECELHYKLYYPIEDHHPDMARRLEVRNLGFTGVTPSTKPVESEPEVKIVTPEGIAPEAAGAANLVDYAHPAIGKVDVTIPEGDTEADIQHLIELLQFPVPQANGEARKRLAKIGMKAVPALTKALGSWDNKTWNQAQAVLGEIGQAAGPAMLDAVASPELYVRLHASEMLARLGWKGPNGESLGALRALLASSHALDRSFGATAIGQLHFDAAAPELTKLLDDPDPDVVRAAAGALAALGAKDSIPDLRAALASTTWLETRRDLCVALARLGDASGIPVLVAGLDLHDDLIRESYFEALFDATALHFGYEPQAPRDERLVAIAKWQSFWVSDGGPDKLRPRPISDWKTTTEVKKLIEGFGGSDGTVPAGDDVQTKARFLELGARAVPGLATIGLKYPPGFMEKRALVCQTLGEIRHPDAVPGLSTALRDPVVSVAAWACWALEQIGDRHALPALQRYHQRLLSLASMGRVPTGAGTPDDLLAQAARACLKLGDKQVEPELHAFLLSNDDGARAVAANALHWVYGAEFDFDPQADADVRRAWVARWQKEH